MSRGFFIMITMDTIIKDPNEILRTKCEKVSLPLSSEDKELLEEMLKYVRDSRDEELAKKYNLMPAVGIAAPQVGINKQMTIVSVEEYDQENDEVILYEFALVNPIIVSKSEKKCALSNGEGCLSINIPHEGYVYRPMRIKVKAYDYLTDQQITLNASGYLAVVIQHEIDHLKGILFYDHINETDPWMEDTNAILI